MTEKTEEFKKSGGVGKAVAKESNVGLLTPGHAREDPEVHLARAALALPDVQRVPQVQVDVPVGLCLRPRC